MQSCMLKRLLLFATLVHFGWTELCPVSCVCDAQDRAECSSLDIEPFPKRLQISTLKLKGTKVPVELSGEKLKELRLESLETLILDRVEIAQMAPSTFSTGHIRTLQISNSKIPRLDKSLFGDSHYMTQVYIEKSHVNEFKGLASSSIKELALIDCHLTNIPKDAFLDLHSLEWLNLEHNRITNFDHVELPPGEINLTLAYNEIPRMHVSKTLLSSLRSLHLSHNPLKVFTIVEDIDLGLEQLYLESTQLSNLEFLKNTSELSVLSLKDALHSFEITADAFNKLENLLHLDISSNMLSDLPQQLFRNNKMLSTLIMDDNNFLTLPVFYFSSAKSDDYPGVNLLKFSCVNCGIRKLNKRTFNFMRVCERIELQNNKLDELPDQLFDSVDITYIDLSGNRLQELPRDIFKNSNILKTLILSRNPLHQISTDLFRNCYQLIELQLNDCALNVLWDSASAKQMSSLRRLSVENNKIFEITLDQLSLMPNLQVLSMMSNPSTCNEQYFKLRNKINERSITYLDPLQDTCREGDQVIEVSVEETSTKEDEITLSNSDQEDNYFLTDAEDVIQIESTRFNKEQRDEVRRELILYLLPTFIFVLTALAVLLVIVSVAMCVLHKKRQNRTINSFDNRFWIPKKHSGTVYRPLSEDKIPEFM